MSVLIVAECGGTHQGRRDALFELLETAARCGASCFKPQFTSSADEMCTRRHIGPDHPKREFYLRAYSFLQFPFEWHAEFRDRCHELGMRYACTVFVPEDAPAVAPFVDFIKIASFENEDRRLLFFAHRTHKPVLVSLGMGVDGDVAWNSEMGPAQYLYCVSAYPAPLSEMNLEKLKTRVTMGARGPGIRKKYDGLSDHSRNVLTGAVAVALGAKIIETHYRLDDCDPNNPDYAVSFSPAEFKQYVENIRNAELMLGDGVRRAQDCERWALPYRVQS